MFSNTQSINGETLTNGFVSLLQEDLIEENPYLLAAQTKEPELAAKAIADFGCMQFHIETIVPVFNSAAYPLIYQTDKITGKGREGQALFDKPGQEYGGESKVVGLIRKMRAAMRSAEAKSYKIAPA